jgi:hypothetical protein
MEVLGLPAHPLIVHVPVIIVPLAALLVVATGWRRDLRRWFMVPLVLLAVAGGIGSVLAANTGEDLEEGIEDGINEAEEERIEEHEEAGDLARNGALAFMVVAIGAGAVAYAGDERRGLPSWSPPVAYAVAAVVGILAVGAMINAGHSGAEAAWKERVAAEGRSGGDDD